jgi:hypothetical protein
MHSAALPQVREKRLLMKTESIDLSAFVQKNGMPNTTDDEVRVLTHTALTQLRLTLCGERGVQDSHVARPPAPLALAPGVGGSSGGGVGGAGGSSRGLNLPQ